MRHQSVVIGIAVGVVLTPWAASAQVGSAAASIVGVVRDASGGVLPGVTVEAASPALIEKVRATVTDAQGQYRIIELRPGTYSVIFTLPGFNVFKREGIELTPNFTATVNAELRVGGIEETITVSGDTPLVDVQNVTAQRVVDKELLDTVPTAKSILALAAFMPAAVTPARTQDVGGSKGEVSVRMSVHGSKPNDQRQLIDGMSYNSLFAQATGRGFYVNPMSMQDIIIDPAKAGSAEYSLGGTVVNAIPRDGANRFSATVFTAWTGYQLQGDNFSDDLRDRGLESINGIREMHDYNFGVGGPVLRDRLWFYTAHRWSGKTTRTANLFWDANPNDYLFTPDVSRPVEPRDTLRSHTLRLTWQASSKDKVNFFYDYQRNLTEDGLGTGTTSREASRSQCTQPAVSQGSWTRPHTNRLLFEGGISFLQSGYYNHGEDLFLSDWKKCGDYQPDRVLIQDTGLGLTYNGNSERRKAQILLMNARWSASYFVGSHSLRTGLFWGHTLYHKLYQDYSYIDPLPVRYRFTNGIPNQLTQFVSSVLDSYGVRPNLGLYLQDQWRAANRLTLNLGLRYDYVAAYVPAIDRPAGLLADAASFDPLDCVPCWHDLSPRASAVYDLFGDGKTAVKVGLSKYPLTVAANLAQTFSPVSSTVNSTTRGWNDLTYPAGDPRRGNFFPDCNLRDTEANGECGAMTNKSFGQTVIRNRPDPDWITGWNKRPYNWQLALSVDRELASGIAINAGYYRTWFGNFSVLDNQLVERGDYQEYCITAPVDARLGAVSGQQICGLYDIIPDKFGQIDTVQTLAKNFGKQAEIYNGVDLNFAVRFARGGQVSGGWNVGNQISVSQAVGQSRTERCFVVDSPGELRHCDVATPYQHRFKVTGSYPLPWDIQAAAVYQNVPSSFYDANLSVPTAQIRQSLGRNLAGGARAVTIPLLAPFSSFINERISQLDLRLSKIFRVNGSRVQANLDIYNALNGNTVLGVINTYGARWLQPTSVLEARLVKFSLQVEF